MVYSSRIGCCWLLLLAAAAGCWLLLLLAAAAVGYWLLLYGFLWLYWLSISTLENLTKTRRN
jgi:hypothetical protein